MFSRLVRTTSGVLSALAIVAGVPAHAQSDFPVSPRASYLDGAPGLDCSPTGNPRQPHVAVDLSALTIVPGDRIRLEMLGDFGYVNVDDEGIMAGVFSATTSASDSLDSGNAAPSQTAFGQDNPHDFYIGWVNHRGATPPGGGPNFRTIEVVVPIGAQFVLAALMDNNYCDNAPTDDDLGLRVALVERGCIPGPEVCDGEDNDCDGLVDEDLPDTEDPTRCDGIDEDCDGQTDEDFIAQCQEQAAACLISQTCDPATGACVDEATPCGEELWLFATVAAVDAPGTPVGSIRCRLDAADGTVQCDTGPDGQGGEVLTVQPILWCHE